MILLVGFILIAVLSYRANYTAYLVKTEQVASLANEGIYYRLATMLTKPVNISQTMAHDSLLIELLETEETSWNNSHYQETIKNYLAAYKEKYGYDSVFLVSALTNNYYNFNGLDRSLEFGDQENDWYYNFLQAEEEYNINVDNDEVINANNKITVFVNCKIKNAAGKVIGIVGVGVNIDYLQDILLQYEHTYNIKSYLIDDKGMIQISTAYNGYNAVDWFKINHSEELRSEVLGWKDSKDNWDVWMPENMQDSEKSYLVVRYIPDLSWYLLVTQDTGAIVKDLQEKMLQTIVLIAAVILTIILIITSVIKKFNVRMTQLLEEKQALFKQATEQIYDNIYELNITKNKASSKRTEEYFEALGAKGLTYEGFLRTVAEKQIKEEFRSGYVATFTTANVMRQFKSGNNYLHYEFMMTEDGSSYFWMRIDAYIFYSATDASVHMFTYRKNIDVEKRKELENLRKASLDEMTGAYTKKATERIIDGLLKSKAQDGYSFFIIDIDNFKQANDLYGHKFGDYCIKEFARRLRSSFREHDIIGRIGGDEFVVLIPIANLEWVKQKAAALCRELNTLCKEDVGCWQMSISVGIAIAPQDGKSFIELYEKADKALYNTKDNGKNGYTVYGDML